MCDHDCAITTVEMGLQVCGRTIVLVKAECWNRRVYRVGCRLALAVAKGADYLSAAMATANDPARKAIIAKMLGIVLKFSARYDEAAQVLSQGTHLLGHEYTDLRRRLEAWLIV